MGLIDNYRALARYNTWMNDSLYTLCAERLTDEQRKRAMGAFFGSLHGTLNHLLLADRVWMRRFTKDDERYASRDAAGRVIEIHSLDQQLYDDFDTLRRERQQTDRDIEAWVDSLDDAQLAANFEYHSMTGVPASHVLWWAVSHMFNHQTHHRGQATTLLMQLGVDPGVTDLIAKLRSE